MFIQLELVCVERFIKIEFIMLFIVTVNLDTTLLNVSLNINAVGKN